MRKRYPSALPVVTLTITALTLREALPADAATCIGGKPTVSASTETVTDCECFAKDPAGTRIFAFDALSVSVRTPSGAFSRSFDPDSILTCDAEHLYVSLPAILGSASDTHGYPLRATTIVSGFGGEQAVMPGERPDSHLERLIEIGRAHLARTL